MFGTVEDPGEMFQHHSVQTRVGSLSSTNQSGNRVVYKLVRVAADGSLVPATDEEMLEVKGLLENNENDMPFIPDPRHPEGYIPVEGSPSQLLQLESLEGLYQSEAAEVYTEKLNSQLEFTEELMYGSQMLTLPDTNFQSWNELSGNEEQVQSQVFLQKPTRFSSNGRSMKRSMDVSPFSYEPGSPKEPALSTAALKPEFSRVAGERCLDTRSIKSLQETFRRSIEMGLINPCVVPTTSLKITDNKPIDEAQNSCSDRIDAFSKDTVDEKRATNFKEKPSSPETSVDHYSGNEDFEGEHRSAKRVRKPTRRYIEENSETDEKQQSDFSMIPPKDESSIQTVSSRGRVVVTRMVSLAGSRIQVPYVSHVRRSRPRENITALMEFHARSWEAKATPEESNLIVSPSQLKNDMNRVSGVKSVSEPVQKESDKGHFKPIFGEVDLDIMEPERIDSSRNNSDDNDDLPMMQCAIRRKHHRAWTLSEVIKLVEGVSKYGVGKWSEIKKLSFSSNAYRTSVDIKDKWRNLLKASFAQTTSNRMGSLRKHGSMAIPIQLLLQVRELAQKQSLVSPVNKTRMVKKLRNGFS